MTQSPPAAQAFQQDGREHGVTILVALALLDAQHHALAVDVAHFQRDHLAGSQTRTVRNRQRRLGLQVGCSSDCVSEAAMLLGKLRRAQAVSCSAQPTSMA